MQVALTLESRNRKTGPIPVSTSSAESCPTSCPLSAGGCYAKGGPLAMYWKKVSTQRAGVPFEQFLEQVKALPEGTLWRHNQAGDLPGIGDKVDALALVDLVDANEGRRGFTYTHKPPTLDGNGEAIAYANENGFTVNMSADNLAEADAFAQLKVGPVVVILPKDQTENTKTPAGRTVVLCPATESTGKLSATGAPITCASCGLCARANRPSIIGFPAHGSSVNKASEIARG